MGESEAGREAHAGLKVCRGEGNVGSREWDRGGLKGL